MLTRKPISATELIQYVKERTNLFLDDAALEVTPIEEGNLNFVFRIVDSASDTSIVAKQAMPYIRIIGEAWPLTQSRIEVEAACISLHRSIIPEQTVSKLHFDPELSLLFLEDLRDMEVLRDALRNRACQAGIGAVLGEAIARYTFATSNFSFSALERQNLLQEFSNPELCVTTEAVFFSDPYCDHERNRFSEQNRELVKSIWNDDALKAQVGLLRQAFLSHPEAVIHGDLHSGSIFVGDKNCKIFDHEFAFVGPIGFDLGVLIANLLLHFCSRIAEEDRSIQEYCVKEAKGLLSTFDEVFFAKASQESRDALLKEPLVIQKFLSNVRAEACGFAGTELIRRTVGIAHVEDIDSIEDEETRAIAERHAILIGKELINLSSTQEVAIADIDCILSELGKEKPVQ